MSTIYLNRSTFTVARNDEMCIELFGVWTNYAPIEYCVLQASYPKIQHFDNLSEALRCFRQITNEPATSP